MADEQNTDQDPAITDHPAVRLSDDRGFGIVQSWVLELPISNQAKLMYAFLAVCAGGSGRTWRSRKTMAEALHCNRRTIGKLLAELRDAGVITVSARYRDSDGRQTSSVIVLPERGFTAPPRVQVDPLPRVQVDPPRTIQKEGTRTLANASERRGAVPGNGKEPWPEDPDGNPVSNVRLVEMFQVLYEQYLGEPYGTSTIDFQMAAKLLRKYPLDEIDSRITRMLEVASGTSDYWRRSASIKSVWASWRELGVSEAPKGGWQK